MTKTFENVTYQNEDAVIHIRDVLGPRELGPERFQHASWGLKSFHCEPM